MNQTVILQALILCAKQEHFYAHIKSHEACDRIHANVQSLHTTVPWHDPKDGL